MRSLTCLIVSPETWYTGIQRIVPPPPNTENRKKGDALTTGGEYLERFRAKITVKIVFQSKGPVLL